MLKFFWSNLDQYKRQYVAMLVVAVLDGVAVFAIPAVLTEFTKGDLDFKTVPLLVVLLVSLYFISLVFSWFTRRYGEALAQEFEQHLRFKLYQRYVSLPYLVLKDHHSGYFLSLSGKVASAYRLFINMSLWTFARGSTMMIFFLVVMARESLVSAVINTGILAIFLYLSTYFAIKISADQKELTRRFSGMVQVFADFLTNVSTVKQLGVHSFAESKILEGRDFTNEQVRKVQTAHAWKWFFLHGIYGIAFIGTVVYLLWLISAGKLSSAVLVVMVGGFMTMRGNLARFSEMVVQGLDLKVSIENLEDVVGQMSESSDGLTVVAKRPKLEFLSIQTKGLVFKYPNSGQTIVYPDFKVEAGEVVCITGESGQGKTSFLNILQGNLAPAKGQILLNNKKTNSSILLSMNDLFIHISQEAELFNLSLYDNLSMGATVTEEFLLQELKGVNLEDWFMNLPDGFATILGEKGTKLSAGQKQRINLVRGLLQDRPVVLLDEPTSHLDSETESVVVKYLQRKLKGKTAVIVTHRDALLKLADQTFLFH